MIKSLPLLLAATSALAACSSDKNAPGTGDGGALDSGSPGTGGSTGSPESSTGGGPEGGGVPVHRDRSHLTNTGTTAALDFSDPALWLCLPGATPNECLVNIDSTEFLKSNTQKVDKHARTTSPAFDCFYVYPTVDLSGKGNVTDFSNITATLDPLVDQAARFSRICQVYAPLYRQQEISTTPVGDSGAAGTLVGDPAVANRDVETSFQYYLDHYNKGRKFVLMGHSQGTATLTNLISKHIDKDAALRAQLISALLIGGLDKTLYAPTGKNVGGTFQNIPFCTTVGETGCVIAYNSFAKVSPPTATAIFGHAPAGSMNACTNPAALAGNTGRYRGAYFPTRFNNVLFASDQPANMIPAVATPFSLDRDMFRGSCVNQNGVSYLEIAVDQTADDMRLVPPYRQSTIEALGFGMHVGDYSVEEDDLIDAVDKQAKAAP